MGIAFRLLLIVAMAAAGSVATASSAGDASATVIARGKYLATMGNCAGCHTARGGKPFAGGLALASPFGTFYTPNITPDPETGIGKWSEGDFWRAMHFGKRPDGASLYPACPYPNYTQVRRTDIDAIYAYLQTQEPVKQTNPAPELSFPASVRAFVAIWQKLFFEPGVYQPKADHDVRWNRGAYLVRGLGHCEACHAARNRFGATRHGKGVPGQRVHGWYAPSLQSSQEAGLQAWEPARGAELLRTGKAPGARTSGPMADVVFESLQHLTPGDALAIATYLHSRPDRRIHAEIRPISVSSSEAQRMMTMGRKVYERNCKDCHGAKGEGSVAAPGLAGNRAVLMSEPTNLIHLIREGGYPPSTAGNPRPFGMPPFYRLEPEKLAAVITYIRRSWGNDAAPVSTADLER